MMWGKENAWTRVFAVSQQFLCLVKTSDLGVDKQNRHCGSEQRRRHLTRGVCECQSPLPLGEVYCTGQVKCVFHHMWKAGLISRPNFNQGTFRSLQRALNILSSSVNICEEVIYSFFCFLKKKYFWGFGFYWQNNWRQDRKQVWGVGGDMQQRAPRPGHKPGALCTWDARSTHWAKRRPYRFNKCVILTGAHSISSHSFTVTQSQVTETWQECSFATNTSLLKQDMWPIIILISLVIG